MWVGLWELKQLLLASFSFSFIVWPLTLLEIEEQINHVHMFYF